jgi:hypothetical protein
MSQIFVAPDSGEENFVALSNSKRGKLFEKHILSYGDLLYPKAKGGKIVIDDEFADRLIENFNKKYCPYVQVPLAGDRNEHSEAPDRNIGQVVGLSKRDGKIYVSMDVRKHADDVGETLLGASAMFDMNYIDTKTMQPVGPTLLHVAVTNRPYVTDLDDFSEIIAASSDSSNDELIVLTNSKTDKEKDMTLDEMFTSLRDEHGIDVPALREKASEAEGVLALSARIADVLKESDLITLSNPADEVTPEQVLGAVTAASEKIVALSASVATLEAEKVRTKAEADVDALVGKGLILPKNRDAMVELSMTNPDLFKSLLPDAPVVALSHEQGTDAEPDEAEVARSEAERIAKEHGLVAETA